MNGYLYDDLGFVDFPEDFECERWIPTDRDLEMMEEYYGEIV